MSGPVIRALPPRPDLEYERKQAKQLLREIRGGDPRALSRVRAQNRGLATAVPEEIKLADAQLAVAREYGFRSWPLLVRYFETLDRHRRSSIHRNRGQDRKWYEGWPASYLKEFRERRHAPAIILGSFVPRFYGLKLEEIFASDPTLDEMRLAVARNYGCASWEELMEAADQAAIDPWREADPARRPASPKLSLDEQLLGHLGMRMQPKRVTALLQEGANPSWMAPNGYTVLEHAIYRYWNGEAVDVLARHATAPDTAFVAAGIGDAARLRRFFDRNGKLTAGARRDRPDLMALSGHGDLSLPDPEDEMLLWPLAFVAAVNARPAALDLLLERGFPIDYHFGMTLLSFAAGNALLPMVELLVSRGASPHVRGYKPSITPLEMAVSRFGQNPEDAMLRRILELLGGDSEAVAREAGRIASHRLRLRDCGERSRSRCRTRHGRDGPLSASRISSLAS